MLRRTAGPGRRSAPASGSDVRPGCPRGGRTSPAPGRAAWSHGRRQSAHRPPPAARCRTDSGSARSAPVAGRPRRRSNRKDGRSAAARSAECSSRIRSVAGAIAAPPARPVSATRDLAGLGGEVGEQDRGAVRLADRDRGDAGRIGPGDSRHTRPPASRTASASTTASGYGVSGREKNSAGARAARRALDHAGRADGVVVGQPVRAGAWPGRRRCRASRRRRTATGWRTSTCQGSAPSGSAPSGSHSWELGLTATALNRGRSVIGRDEQRGGRRERPGGRDRGRLRLQILHQRQVVERVDLRVHRPGQAGGRPGGIRCRFSSLK